MFTIVSFFSGRNNDRAPARQTTVSFFFPVVMKISRHNKKTANFPPTDDCIFFFPVVIKISRHYKKQYNSTTRQTDDCIFFFPVVIARTAHPSDRRLYLFFPVVMYLFFFLVVMKISRHNKKTAYFQPEPKKLTQHHNCMVLQVHSSMYNQNLFPARTKN